MPYYLVKFRRDLGFLKKYSSEQDVEGDSAEESVAKFLREDFGAEVDASVALSIQRFMQNQMRMLKVKSPRGGAVQVLWVRETDSVRCVVCMGTGSYERLGEVCFACNGRGEINPSLARHLESHLASEIERRGITSLEGREYLDRMREIVDDLQLGRAENNG